jgi:hypothetical protein
MFWVELNASGSADHKGDCLGFRLTHYLGGSGAPLGLVQHLVCDFMDKSAELLRWGLAGKQDNLASVADTQRRGDALFELKQDALRCDEIEQPFLPLSYIATDPARKLWKLQAFGLRDIEDVHGTEAD